MSWGAQPACKVWEGQRPPGHSIPEHHVRLGGGASWGGEGLGEDKTWGVLLYSNKNYVLEIRCLSKPPFSTPRSLPVRSSHYSGRRTE